MSEADIYVVALAVVGGVGLLFVLVVSVMLLGAIVLDRIEDARNHGYINLSIMGVGLHFFSMRFERNQRFVRNAKLVGYLIREGRRVSVGLGLPGPVQRLVKKARGRA